MDNEPTHQTTDRVYTITSGVIVLAVFALLSLQYFRLSPEEIPYQNPQTITVREPENGQTSTTTTPLELATTTATSTIQNSATSTKKIQSKAKPISKTQSVAAPTTPLVVQTPPLLNLSDLNTINRQSLVNIFCTTNDGGLRPITGSGMIIDERGVILTNAHIGQYILLQSALRKGTVECTIRTGSPAKSMYRVALLYLSNNWIRNNYKGIAENNPTGTGEDDFALLYITSALSGYPLPDHFPAVAIDTSNTNIKTGDQVLALGYPAGFLGGIAINQDLYAVTSVATVGTVFTFKTDTFDLFSIGGTPVAQKGSSGGGVVNQINGRLSGLIVTTSEADTTGSRDLHAITLSHINRSLESQEGKGINEFLQGDLATKSLSFYETEAPDLAQILIDAIKGRK